MRNFLRKLAKITTRKSRGDAVARSAQKNGKLHLGSGVYIFEGWTNLDTHPGAGGFVWDLTEPLPLPSASISYIFTEHFIEHMHRSQCLALMTECRRVIKDDGVLRVSTPDLSFLVDQYIARRTDEWSDVGWTPPTPCRMVNEGVRRWGHHFVYDQPELTSLLREAGFANIEVKEWRESSHECLRNLEVRPFHRELIVEAMP